MFQSRDFSPRQDQDMPERNLNWVELTEARIDFMTIGRHTSNWQTLTSRDVFTVSGARWVGPHCQRNKLPGR
jgi:hypothetical protein